MYGIAHICGGGLLMGAVVDMRLDLFKVVIADALHDQGFRYAFILKALGMAGAAPH